MATDTNFNLWTLDDFVFQNRNKEYGAYFLRKNYGKIVLRALIIGTLGFGTARVAPTIYKRFAPEEVKKEVKVVELKLEEPPPLDEEKPPPPPPPPPPKEMPKVNTIKFLPPEIKKDEEIQKIEPPPKVEELKEAVAATKTEKGENPTEVSDAPIDEPKPEAKKIEIQAEDVVFTVVEQPAEYLGGYGELAKFLQKNLRYPSAAQRAGVSGKVFLSFIVNSKGLISDVQILKGIGFGCDEEAVRVVRSMPPWKAAKQSGREVKSKFTLPISFTLE